MEIDYYKITSELDAREILRYLNNLGIHNISGEVLKYFITDLKKLIKHDLENKHHTVNKYEVVGPERLHSASTFSSRIRSRASDGTVENCTRECHQRKKSINVRNIVSAASAPNLGPKLIDETPPRRACSCVRVQKKPETAKEKVTPTITSSNNLIKVAKPPATKKCDPVTLYHHYTSLWAKYKQNVPGENDWSELRWSVRQKMAGNVGNIKPTVNKLPDSQRDKEGAQAKKLQS